MHTSSTLSRRRLLQAASALCLTRPLRSFADPTFTTDVQVVNVFVTVRDKKGNIVTNLTKDDFVLTEDGAEQTVRYFARQSDLPLTLGLVIDTTPSESNMLGIERNASSLFFDKVLRPEKDRAFVIQFADDVQLLQDLTSSRAKLEKALAQLEDQDQPHLRRASDPGDDRQSRPNRGGGGADSTVLSDAIFLGADEVLKPQTGRKAMIVLGDGDHVGDRQQQAVMAAQRADSLVYAIRIYDRDFGGGERRGNWHGLSVPNMGIPGIGMGGPGGGPGGGGPGGPGGGGPGGGGPSRSSGKHNLEEIAGKTGGAYFEVTKKQTLEQIYAKIDEELRSQYSLGYTPAANSNGGYRRIKVTAKQKGLTVQARDGYYPKNAQS